MTENQLHFVPSIFIELADLRFGETRHPPKPRQNVYKYELTKIRKKMCSEQSNLHLNERSMIISPWPIPKDMLPNVGI